MEPIISFGWIGAANISLLMGKTVLCRGAEKALGYLFHDTTPQGVSMIHIIKSMNKKARVTSEGVYRRLPEVSFSYWPLWTFPAGGVYRTHAATAPF